MIYPVLHSNFPITNIITAEMGKSIAKYFSPIFA